SSILDPRVKKINITWLGGDKVLEVPVNSPADTVTIIDGLKEGNYVFNFLTFDGEGNHSVKTEVLGEVYDATYERDLILREVTMLARSGTTLTITFRSMEGVAAYNHQELTYLSSIPNMQKTLQFEDPTNQLTITDFAGSGFSHRSVYLPQERS